MTTQFTPEEQAHRRKVAIALADGKQIQVLLGEFGIDHWTVINQWRNYAKDLGIEFLDPAYEWRVAPETKPDVVEYWKVKQSPNGNSLNVKTLISPFDGYNLKLTVNG